MELQILRRGYDPDALAAWNEKILAGLEKLRGLRLWAIR